MNTTLNAVPSFLDATLHSSRPTGDHPSFLVSDAMSHSPNSVDSPPAPPLETDNPKYWRTVLFALFALSGFSGLIYESVWSNYLKLFLGHAAYAQTLVLALFMGGMALGAWLSGYALKRIKNPLMTYVFIELIIGCFGLSFHFMFQTTSNFLLNSVLPGIESPWLIETLRWLLASCLILPQTLLLGATFPLISAGILRAYPNTPGASISMLYFSNSIGAVAGVLVAGFVLVKLVGLPGTTLTAGLINFLLAFLVFAINKQLQLRQAVKEQSASSKIQHLRPMLIIALITGLSSFIYEISWIRMLSMVLGSTTHSFELMLSSFILGLALGGLWLNKRIDRFQNPIFTLGLVQLWMGLLALLTLLWYNTSFEFSHFFLNTIKFNNNGYLLYNLFSYLQASLLMLPVTFLAGMTLPLISYVLYKNGGGETAISKVYAFNTLGAILGVALAAFVLLPYLGLKLSVITGACLDLLLALFLLSQTEYKKWRNAAVGLSVAGVLMLTLAPPFDTSYMASGVFRRGVLDFEHTRKSLMHQDGKTASVTVFSVGTQLLIATNGKVDASISLDPKASPTGDEDTMTMLGGLPLVAHPDAKTAAVIGIGAGASANILLHSKRLQNLDVIEIESAMVKGAKFFGETSRLLFTDPRSKIHIDDAKSFFSSHQKKYDIIVSEPSDSWVSGVANLFTDEFYQRITKHLQPRGLLVQWLHLYEVSPAAVSSIFTALGKHFQDYRVYASNSGNLIILAQADGKIPSLSEFNLLDDGLKQAFARVGIQSSADLHLQELGGKSLLHPYFLLENVPANSDFFPYVDQQASRARFTKSNSTITQLKTAMLPMPGANFHGQVKSSNGQMPQPLMSRLNAQSAHTMMQFLASQGETTPPTHTPEMHRLRIDLIQKQRCQDSIAREFWTKQLTIFAANFLPFSTKDEAAPALHTLQGLACTNAANTQAMLRLMAAVSARNPQEIEKNALPLLKDENAQAAEYARLSWQYALFLQGRKQELAAALYKYPHDGQLWRLMLGHAQVGRQ
ncbi:fused MFS/spermidine synthase [Massilia sp. W12]|uniref:fused MFS/spermidine synthase n=1 Tax=Massilia sp. W12 TaxID=3126507 RepID=UPI0030D11F7C